MREEQENNGDLIEYEKLSSMSLEEKGIYILNKCLTKNIAMKNGDSICINSSTNKFCIKKCYVNSLGTVGNISVENNYLLGILDEIYKDYKTIRKYIKSCYLLELGYKELTVKDIKTDSVEDEDDNDYVNIIKEINGYCTEDILYYYNNNLYIKRNTNKLKVCPGDIKDSIISLSNLIKNSVGSDIYNSKLNSILKKLYDKHGCNSKFIYSPFLVQNGNITFNDTIEVPLDTVLSNLDKINKCFNGKGISISGSDFCIGNPPVVIDREDILSLIEYKGSKKSIEYYDFIGDILKKYDKRLYVNIAPITNRSFQNKVIKEVKKENNLVLKYINKLNNLPLEIKEFLSQYKNIFNNITGKTLVSLIENCEIDEEENRFYYTEYEYKNNFFSLKVTSKEQGNQFEIDKIKVTYNKVFKTLESIINNIKNIGVLKDFVLRLNTANQNTYTLLSNESYSSLENEYIKSFYLSPTYNSAYIANNITVNLPQNQSEDAYICFKDLNISIKELNKKRLSNNLIKKINEDFERELIGKIESAKRGAMSQYEKIKEKLDVLNKPSNAAIYNIIEEFPGRGITTIVDILYGSKSSKMISNGYVDSILHGALSFLKKDVIDSKINDLERKGVLRTDRIKTDYGKYYGYFVNKSLKFNKDDHTILTEMESEIESYKINNNIPIKKNTSITISNIKQLLNLSSVDSNLEGYEIKSSIKELDMNDINKLIKAVEENKTFMKANWQYISKSLPIFTKEQLTLIKFKANLATNSTLKSLLNHILKTETSKSDIREKVI